jgi:cytochrome c-type biogenesis protein CcmH
MIKTIVLLFTLLLAQGTVVAREAAPLAEDPAIEARMVAMAEDLRCLVCQNQSLAASDSDFAHDVRREIRAMMKEGKSDQEIKDFLVQRFGDFILFRPPVKSYTLPLWLGPFVLLIIGTTVLMLVLRRRKRQAATAQTLSEEDHKRASALLREEDDTNGDDVQDSEGQRI